VAALDRAGTKLSVALFAKLEEYENWRMVLAAREFDRMGLQEGYGRLFQILNNAGIVAEKTPTISIFPTNDPFIRELRKIFGKTKSVEGMILGSQSFGGRFIEDAYVYRIR
jgi:hypothetical protein